MMATLAASVAHARQLALTVSDDVGFHRSLSDHLLRIPSEEVPLAASLGDDFAETAQALDDEPASSTSIQSDQYQWFKVTVDNPQSRPINLTLYNPLPVYSLVVLGSDGSMSRVGYREDDVTRAPQRYFPFTHFQVPPGTSQIYLGAKAPGRFHHAALFPAVASERWFAYYWMIRTLIGSLFMFAILILFVIVAMLAFLLRDRLAASYSLLLASYAATYGAVTGLLRFDLEQAGDSIVVWPMFAEAAITFYMLFAIQYFQLWGSRLDRWLKAGVATNVLLLALYYAAVIQKPYFLLANSVNLSLFTVAALYLMLCKSRRWLSALTYSVAFVPVAGHAVMVMLQHSGYLTPDGLLMEALPLCAFLNGTAVMLGFGHRILLIKRNRDILEANLKTIVSPDYLKRIDKDTPLIDVEPVVREVTILFVDVVGYSVHLKRMPPEESFKAMKALLAKLTTIIHKYDGVVDRSLGDGCLAFFGSDLSGRTVPGHARTAVECAVEIQRTLVGEVNAKGLGGDEQLFMLRIGINTAEVCIGNIGDETRFDFTLSGSGVVHASRLESACEPCKINISKSTHDALDASTRRRLALFHKMIAIKNEATLGECYEVNPFVGAKAELERCRQAFYEAIGARVRHERVKPQDESIAFSSAHGEVSVVNFSRDGFCLRVPRYLGKGVTFTIDLSTVLDHPRIEAISPVAVEVAWGAPAEGDDRFVIGVALKYLDDRKKVVIFEELKKLAQPEPNRRFPSILVAS